MCFVPCSFKSAGLGLPFRGPEHKGRPRPGSQKFSDHVRAQGPSRPRKMGSVEALFEKCGPCLQGDTRTRASNSSLLAGSATQYKDTSVHMRGFAVVQLN